MSLIAKASEALRNSPLMQRRSPERYAPTETCDPDPFANGVNFYCEYLSSADLALEDGRGDKNSAAIVERLHCSAKAPFRRFSVLVKDQSIRVKDVADNRVTHEIPIHLVSFCGSHASLDRTFCIVHRYPRSDKVHAQLFRAADKSKAQAMVKTVSKVFSIAYCAWQAKQSEKKRTSLAANKDSPRGRRKLADPNLVTERSNVDDVTEQMGVIAVTVPGPSPKPEAEADDDIDDEFTSLAASRSNPDLLANDVEADPKLFNWKETKVHADPGSPSLLLIDL